MPGECQVFSNCFLWFGGDRSPDAAAAGVAIAEMRGPMAIADAAAAAAAIAGMGGPGLSFDVKDAVKEERWREKDRAN